jgi:hypothetical protein
LNRRNKGLNERIFPSQYYKLVCKVVSQLKKNSKDENDDENEVNRIFEVVCGFIECGYAEEINDSIVSLST